MIQDCKACNHIPVCKNSMQEIAKTQDCPYYEIPEEDKKNLLEGEWVTDKKYIVVLCWGASHFAQICSNNKIPEEKAIFAANKNSLEGLRISPDNTDLLVDPSFWQLPQETREGILEALESRGYNWLDILEEGR